MKNKPICGDIAKSVENLNRPIYTSSASLKDFIYNIVTRTEILALVSLKSNTNIKWNRPILGDMPKVINNLEGHFLLLLLQSTVLWQNLWPRLRFWHWSLFCWVPRSYDIDQRLVTSQLVIIHWFYSSKIDHQPPNILMSMLLYDYRSIIDFSNSQ